MSLFHLYVGFFGPPNAFTPSRDACRLRAGAGLSDTAAAGARRRPGATALDWLLIALSLAATVYPVMSTDYINTRMVYVADLRTVEACSASS